MKFEIISVENDDTYVVSLNEIFARKCSITEKGINCGYVTSDGTYFSEKINYKLLLHINRISDEDYSTLKDAYADEKYYLEDWEWYDEWCNGKDTFYLKNGTEIKIIRTID